MLRLIRWRCPGPLFLLGRIASSDSRVVVCANFDMLVCYLVPMSSWWWKSLRIPGQEQSDSEFS